MNFLPLQNSGGLTGGCLGLGAANCVSDNEGIPGNQVLATAGPNKGDLLIAHTSADGNQVIVDRGAITSGTGGLKTATWTPTVLNASLCPDPATVTDGTSQICGASNFATIAQDSAGHFYVTFASQQKTTKSGTATESGPEEVYVVESDDGTTWGKPVLVSTAGGSNAFPWMVAGSDGRVAISWYHTNEESENGGYLFDDLKNAEFSVQLGTSLDARSTSPTYSITTVSEHPVKFGSICTGGLGCTVSGGDRSLGDYLQDHIDDQGRLIVTYVDDTSNYYTSSDVPGGDTAESGPNVVSRQVGGPSMIADDGTISGAGDGPGLDMDTVSDPTGDGFLSLNTQVTPASGNLDLTGASVAESAGSTDLTVTMKLADLSSLMASPTLGGTAVDWIMRFTTYDPATPGNGHIYYAGAESVAGQAPSFFDGDVDRPSSTGYKYAEFDSTHAITGTVDQAAGTITLTVPRADIGNEADGKELYSITAFTATTTTHATPVALLNQIDATAPFNHVLGTVGTAVGVAPGGAGGSAGGGAGGSAGGGAGGSAGGGAGGSAGGQGSLASTGLDVGVPVVAVVLLGGAAWAVRRRRA